MADETIDAEIKRMEAWVRSEIAKLVQDYWDAYYLRQAQCKKINQKMDWHAGCRAKTTKSGARIDWFYIQPVARGRKSLFKHIKMDSDARSTETVVPFSKLQKAEKETINYLVKQEKRVREVEKKIRDIKYQLSGVRRMAEARGYKDEDFEGLDTD